ncbi:Ktr system potassium uptake protein B [Actinomyces bovis]|uniref:Ktr system potassium uptake protein B n=2 Tax=Actinomyces bovis TaxID=1658 RepID=A0ABY1VKA0_9ACTO|nr:Ktr system potassium uptake protein B [Actinomyces bovis]VEG54274.1 Ktr system potassium uptake protein B [Actinomyces israelii]
MQIVGSALAAAGRSLLAHPARIVPSAYLVGWVLGTILLRMPWCANNQDTTWWQAAFTSMSALCITGLAVVDTASHWSTLGQAVILLLIQVGGFGIMTLTSMVIFSVTNRVSPKVARITQEETRSSLKDIRRLPARILWFSLACEGLLTFLLTVRFLWRGLPTPSALYHGLFHSISAFNNAGFALYPDNLVSFNQDPWIMVPICVAIVVGGIGFPVWTELADRRLGRRKGRLLSVHLRMTLWTYAILLAVGFLAFIAFEWNNPHTIGNQPLSGKLLGALGGAVFPRTAGFNSIDYGEATGSTLLLTDALMIIGGGTAGTAGGLKVTTVAVLLLTVVAEIRGEGATVVGGRRVSMECVRSALAVAVLGTVIVFTAVLLMASREPFTSDALAFEAFSAFGTVGLSTGVTPHISHLSWGVLMILMYLGRVGPVSAAAALATRTRRRRFAYPPEDPLVG